MPTEEAEYHTLQVMFRIVTDFIEGERLPGMQVLSRHDL
jgi:hypothetical protein